MNLNDQQKCEYSSGFRADFGKTTTKYPQKIQYFSNPEK